MHNDQNQGQDRYPERVRLTPQADHYSPGGPGTLPAVSVVMPVLNEEKHLAESVAAVLAQDYPGGFELVLAIGPSKDRTEAIARGLAAADSRITVVPNPSGQIASAMNAAVKTARHEILTRIDAHSMLPDGYLRTAVRALMDTGAADVGGWMAAEGATPFQSAVAWAMTSPFGVGAAANHTGGDAGPADTVYLGVYRREAIEKVGGYDETMLIAEDWELNYRIRAAGGLPPEDHPGRPGEAAVPVRPLAPGRRPSLPRDGQPPLPGPAGRDRAERRGPGPRRGRAHRGAGRGGRPRCLPDPRIRYSGRLPRRRHRGRREVRRRPARRGAGARPAGPRHYAFLLGCRLPHQPSPPGQAALTRLSACGRRSGVPAAKMPY
jgi:hypothetical protein